MKEIFVMNKEMHMGPISRNVKTGDVLTWEPELDRMSINGSVLKDDGKRDRTAGFEEVARLLKIQAGTCHSSVHAG